MPGGTTGTFGMMPGNNAPLPPSTSLNTTGTQSSGWGFGGSNFPNYPMFGPSGTGIPTPTANLPLFGSSGMLGLNSGFGVPYGGNDMGLMGSLDSAFGSGTGHLIDSIFSNGLFNPQVAASFLNAMQPAINRGESNILGAFGAEGSRFGSAAALGLGDFMSQANLNEQQTLAGMFMQAQQEQLSLLENILPTLHSEQANKGGWLHDLVGGLEIAGSIAADVVTAGAAVPFTMPLIAQGIGQIAQGVGGGGGGGSSPSGGNIAPFMMPGTNGIGGTFNTGTFGINAPTYNNQNWQDQMMLLDQEATAGASLGGSSSMFAGLNSLYGL